MARLSFFCTDIAGNRFEINEVMSYQLSMDWDAACDGLRLEYNTDTAYNELCKIEVFNGKKRIFNGLVDTQREQCTSNGTSGFVYARSSACLLTDNESVPAIYSCPSALTLFACNAEPLGFTSNLPKIFSDNEYQVSKGVSCFGAINDFVEGMCGSRIVVDSNNCISLLQEGGTVRLDASTIISEKRSINRGDVVTRLDYKTDSANGFDHHLISRYFDKKGIAISKKSNISSLPSWQRDYSLLGAMRSASRQYITYDIEVLGGEFSLGDIVQYTSNYFGKIDDVMVVSICYVLNKNGESIRLKLAQNIDLEEITYVD